MFRRAYFAVVLPYPHSHVDRYKAALCSHENAVVRKRPECWTCSWCVRGSDIMLSDVLSACNCKITQKRSARNNGGNQEIIGRAA